MQVGILLVQEKYITFRQHWKPDSIDMSDSSRTAYETVTNQITWLMINW